MRDHEDAHTMQVNRCAASDMGSYKLVVESQQGETAVSNFTLTVVPRQYQAVQQMRQKLALLKSLTESYCCLKISFSSKIKEVFTF